MPSTLSAISVEIHAAGARKMLHQFGQVLLITDVAGAGGVPEVHDPDTPRPREFCREVQHDTCKQRGFVTERADVSPLKPPIASP